MRQVQTRSRRRKPEIRGHVTGIDMVRRAGPVGRPPAEQRQLSVARRRIGLAMVMFIAAFAVVGGRLVELGLVGTAPERHLASRTTGAAAHRPDIVDRNGAMLASDIVTPSLYADARQIIEPEVTARALASVLPELDEADLLAKFKSGRAFIWLKRELTPKEQAAVLHIGQPGLHFRDHVKRVYPAGAVAGHIVGTVDVDNKGIAGLERYLNGVVEERAAAPYEADEPLRLSLDLKIQHALRQELAAGMSEFKAKAAVGVVLDAKTGEVVAMTSLPDFDPNRADTMDANRRFDRAALGVYELGSVFKAFTTAAALDSGRVDIDSRFDAREPIKVSRFTISDYHGQDRWMAVPDVFMHSSNIGTAKMAMTLGRENHQAYLRRFGLLDRLQVELPETGTPLVPKDWTDLSTMTISFGHGLSVSPLQLTAAAASLVNGGYKVQPTFIKRTRMPVGERVLHEETSRQMQALLRLVVTDGTGGNADVPAYPVMGKTGTAEKPGRGGYSKHKLITSFLGAFPAQAPRYVTFVMFDEPHPTKNSYGYATAGWNAAPVTANLVKRIAPLLGVPPRTLPRRDPGAAIPISYQP